MPNPEEKPTNVSSKTHFALDHFTRTYCPEYCVLLTASRLQSDVHCYLDGTSLLPATCYPHPRLALCVRTCPQRRYSIADLFMPQE